jgi:Transposase DDE domain
MFKDTARQEVYNRLREHDLRIFAKLLTWDVFLSAAMRSGLKLACNPLNLANLVWLGVAAAWRKTESFVTILVFTLKLLQDQEAFAQNLTDQKLANHRQPGRRRATKSGRGNNSKRGKTKRGKNKCTGKSKHIKSKHNPHGNDPTQVTEEAFAKARRRMPLSFWLELILVLGERFEAQHAERLQFQGFRLLAMDGTRLTLPDEKALRDYYGTAVNGKGRQNAQARMVLLQSPLTRLPLAYQLQPVNVGEVTMARQLVAGLRPGAGLRANDLLLLDAGYLSYGLLWDIQSRGAFFCIRMQRNMNLRSLPRLPGGSGDSRRERWVRWTPKDSRGKWRAEGLPRSIDLRLISYHVPGHRRIQLLTNVLQPSRLSYDDFSRLTTTPEAAQTLLPGLYHLRWQIETSFAELKTTQQMEGGFRSRKPEGIAYEVAGHMVLYLLVRWLIVEAADAHGVDPLRISFSNALRELQLIWQAMLTASPAWADELWTRLLQRIASHRVPLRPGRSYPRKKKAKGKTAKSKRKKG